VWGLATNQIYVFTPGGFRPTNRWFFGQFTWFFYWMVGLQTALGLVFLGLAVAGLRPLRGSSWPGGKPKRGWWSKLAAKSRAITGAKAAAPLTRNRILTNPPDRAPCGDDPMFWKERHTSIGGGLRWLGSRPMVLFFGVLLGCYLLDVSYPVLTDLLDGKWHAGPRSEVSDALRGSSMVLAVLGMLGVAAASAVSITGEREQDTWISLMTTLLTPLEIIRAKQLGAVWSARRVGLALVVMWAAGILLGAIHPFGVLAAALYSGLIAWLIATLGVFVSSRAKNSTRALVATFVVFLIFSAVSRWPAIVWELLFAYRDLAGLRSEWVFIASDPWTAIPSVLGLGTLVAVYAGAGALFTFGSTRRLRATWGQ
jgi:hypothetical protein